MKEADGRSFNLPKYTEAEVFIVTLLPSHKSTKKGQKCENGLYIIIYLLLQQRKKRNEFWVPSV